MRYDFTSILDRKNKDALAFDAVGNDPWGFAPTKPKDGFDFIPLWVADMNFPTCPTIIESISGRIAHPAFGYFLPGDDYYRSIINWQKSGHTNLSRENIGYENGVHGFITSAVSVLTKPGDAILLHSPVYLGFEMDVGGLGRRSVYSPLYLDEENIWRMDYKDMDQKIKENYIRTVIFCSPHNPTGRVWSKEELEKAAEVFMRNGVTVISDEIWSDIVFDGHEHIPFQSINQWAEQNTVAAYAPSKTFNLAGLIGSYHIIYNQELNNAIQTWGDRTHYNSMNVLSMYALIGAYSMEGRLWKNELCEVLQNNVEFVFEFFHTELPFVSVSMPQGTYMMFIDCKEYLSKTGRTMDDVLKAGWDVGVGWQDGRKFKGMTHIRLNLASPLSRIQEACQRMKEYVFI